MLPIFVIARNRCKELTASHVLHRLRRQCNGLWVGLKGLKRLVLGNALESVKEVILLLVDQIIPVHEAGK